MPKNVKPGTFKRFLMAGDSIFIYGLATGNCHASFRALPACNLQMVTPQQYFENRFRSMKQKDLIKAWRIANGKA